MARSIFLQNDENLSLMSSLFLVFGLNFQIGAGCVRGLSCSIKLYITPPWSGRSLSFHFLGFSVPSSQIVSTCYCYYISFIVALQYHTVLLCMIRMVSIRLRTFSRKSKSVHVVSSILFSRCQGHILYSQLASLYLMIPYKNGVRLIWINYNFCFC